MEAIEEMNGMLKTLPKTDELMNVLYVKRQKAVDAYYAMNALILKQTKLYKATYQTMFNSIKINGYNGMRFSSDQAIARQIEVDTSAQKETIDLLTNHNNYIKDTIQTIDNLIYSIKYKVTIHELINGIKTI